MFSLYPTILQIYMKENWELVYKHEPNKKQKRTISQGRESHAMKIASLLPTAGDRYHKYGVFPLIVYGFYSMLSVQRNSRTNQVPRTRFGEAKYLSLRKIYDSVKRVSPKRRLCADSSPLGLCTKDNLRLPIAYPLNLETWAEGDIFMLIEMLTGRKSKLQTIYLSI